MNTWSNEALSPSSYVASIMYAYQFMILISLDMPLLMDLMMKVLLLQISCNRQYLLYICMYMLIFMYVRTFVHVLMCDSC